MNVILLFRRAARDFWDDDCLSSAAAIAFYTVFSLPPLLTIVFSITATLGYSDQDITQFIQREMGLPLPSAPVEDTPSGVALSRPDGNTFRAEGLYQPVRTSIGFLAQSVSVILVLIAASGVFAQMQYSLNKAWEVAPDPQQGGVLAFLIKRLWSMSLIFVMALILLGSLLLTAWLERIIRWAGTISNQAGWVGSLLSEVLSFVVITGLFASIYQILPDAKIRWRDVWATSAITAALFVVGKTIIGWHLATGGIGESWGASAVSAISALVWVYYTSLIVLFGGELTHVWSDHAGTRVEPETGAVHMVQSKQMLCESPPNTEIHHKSRVDDRA